MHVNMSRRRASSESSIASYVDDLASQTVQLHPHGHVRPPTQPSAQQTQQPWYPTPYYPPYAGAVPLADNYIASYPHFAAQPAAASRWDGFDPLDEEEQQERRKKGKELVPIGPMMNGHLPPPWAAYPGGYGQGAYGPMGNPLWPALLPPPQQAPLPLLPLPGEQYTSRRPSKHVRHYDEEQPGASRRRAARSPHRAITLNRAVDGILTPSSGDLTVHLAIDLEEDLEEHLDEMNRLSRLGHFSLAKEFFSENLQHHMDNPYVLVQYADLLLHQGDFKGVTLLKDDPIYKREGEQSNLEELRILRIQWELLQILAKSYTLDTLNGVPTVLEEAVNVLTEMAKDSSQERVISSTEIEILVLTLRLTSLPALNSKWLRYGGRALAAFSLSLPRLYQTLLRQGRIWDFHDFVVLMPTIEDTKALTYDIFGKDLIPSLQSMVSDWSDSVHGYDASTTLGLLSIMTHLLLEPVEATEKECIDILKLCLPLAISVVENDPSSLKSQPYLRLLLAKSRFAETASRQAVESLVNHLQSSQGIYYQTDISLLPIYVPSGNETPQWTPMNQPSELKDPVRLVLRSAIELGDFATEALARRELIRLSASPRDEFDKLCTLQLSRQGDLNGYGLTLASKYLVSNTKEAKEELAISISRLLSRVASTDYWDPSLEWILNMLLYKIEGKSPSTIQHMLERSHADYHNIEESLLREISRKMPTLKEWVDQQQLENSTQSKLRDTVLRAGSSSRRSNKSTTKQKKSPALRRTAIAQPPRRVPRSTEDGRTEERALLVPGSRPEDQLQDGRPQSESRHPVTVTIHDDQQSAADVPRNDQETSLITPVVTPRVTYVGSNGNPEHHHIPPPRSASVDIALPASGGHEDSKLHEAQLRAKYQAEFNERFEIEKEFERKRRNERMAIMEALKQQVEAIRKEAVDQAEKKIRVETQERFEQQGWEKRMEERKLETETSLAKAIAAAEAESTAKVEAARRAIEEEKKKMKEETEMLKKKERETLQQQLEREIRNDIEDGRRAYEEAEAAAKLKEEQQRRAEAERKERQEMEARDFEAAVKQAEEENTRKWAAEEARKDQETQNQIHLKDAVGRKFMIPFAIAQTWQGMEQFIESAFAHVEVVGHEVRMGHYDLIGPDGTIVLPQIWELMVQPGWHISMHMWPMSQQPPMPAHPGSRPMVDQPAPPVGNASPRPAPPPPNWPLHEDAGTDEPGEQAASAGDAEAEDDDDAMSSGYGSSVSTWPPSRRRRIANAFSALKTKVFRRPRFRRGSWSPTDSSSDELAE
ncbi:hypothetical protein GGS24DRAFT_118203 [Hypoxylon argillaceum]|nr:hypothetical protein GGS24DRAFT_118203 [Hypoxylon argillaceum]